jgi:hypothetical protein
MTRLSWKDLLHYGAGFGLIGLGILGECGVPGIDGKTCILSGAGIIGAGLKGGWSSGAVPKIIAVLAFAGAFCLFAPHARAQEAIKAPALTGQACAQTDCSGFFLGLSLYGEGGNADIVQNGLNGSVFAGGGMVGANGGYQLWNGDYFIAAEFDALVESDPSAGTGDFAPGGFVGLVHVKLGGNAGELLGTATPAGSQGPISIPQQLLSSLMSPYLDFCTAIREDTTQWCGGAGAQFSIGGRWTADLIYDYGAPTNKLNALQIVGLQADYHF